MKWIGFILSGFAILCGPGHVRILSSVKAEGTGGAQLAVSVDPHPEEENPVLCVAYSKDGSLLASGGSFGDQTNGRVGDLRVWDAKTGLLLRRLGDHADEVCAVAFTPDGRHLAASDNDGAVRVWDLRDTKPPRTLQAGEGVIWSLTISPDGRTIAAGGSSHIVRIRDLNTGRIVLSLAVDEEDEVRSVVYLHQGARLAAGTDRGYIRIWDVTTRMLVTTLRGHLGAVDHLTVSPDGRILASTGAEGTVRLWDSATGEPLKILRPPHDPKNAFGPEDRAGEVAFSPDGSVLAAVRYVGDIRLWDVKAGQTIRLLHEDDLSVNSVAFSPDGKLLASGTDERGLVFWDWSQGRLFRARKRGQEPN